MNTANSAIALGRSAAIQARVVGALIIRELKTRFGTHRLGYLYVILEPAAVGALVVLVHSYRKMAPVGIHPAPFILLGFISLRLFNSVISRSEGGIRANRSLLLHPVIKTLDIVIARALLEAAVFVVVLIVLLGIGSALGWAEPPHDLLRVIGAFVMLVAIGVGIGLNIAASATMTPILERLMGPIHILLMFSSATFVSMDQLPPGVRELCLINPLTHVQEILRDAFFPNFGRSYGDPAYLARWIVLSLFFGLIAERLTRPHIWHETF